MSVSVVAQWGPRPESRDDAAKQVALLLRGLSAVDPLLGSWFKKGNSVKDALKTQFPVDAKALARYVVPDKVMPDLGCRFAAWNGNNEAAASLRVSVGGSTPRVSNSVRLELPPSDSAHHLLEAESLDRLIRLIARIFDPEWIQVRTSKKALGEARPVLEAKTFLRGAAQLLQPGYLEPDVRLDVWGDDVLLTVESEGQMLDREQEQQIRRVLERSLHGHYPWTSPQELRPPSARRIPIDAVDV